MLLILARSYWRARHASHASEPPNKRMKPTKRSELAGWPALTRLRRAIFVESRFAAYPQCWADSGVDRG